MSEIESMFAADPAGPADPSPEISGLFDDFSIFGESAWKPFKDWDSEPLTRQLFADNLHELAGVADNLRAAMLYRFSRSIADRLGASDLSLVFGEETGYNFEHAGVLKLDYRISLIGATAIQQMNSWIGLLVRGIGEHLANQPGSQVQEFMLEMAKDFSKFNLPFLGTYVADTAAVAITDRAIAAHIADEYPGFSKFALDGLYQLSAQSAQKFFGMAEKALATNKLPDGKELSREDALKLELEMASTYLQAESTAPGESYIDSTKFPWAMDIEKAGTMYRNIKDLSVDHEFATKGSQAYGSVVERILKLPEKPPCPPENEGGGDEGTGPEGEGGELPDLGALQGYHTGAAASGDAANSAEKPKSSMENMSKLGTDVKTKFDQEKFEKILDQESEMCDERTPWAEGQETTKYFTVKAKAGPIARLRYAAIKKAYGPQIRTLRKIISDAYQTRTTLERGLRSGRPDPVRLTSIRFGRQDVFKKNTIQTEGEPIDIILLIDESGSMTSRCTSKGYVKLPAFVDRTAAPRTVEMAGTAADNNVRADCAGGTRADVARAFSVMVSESIRGLPGIRSWTYGYTTGNPSDYGLPKNSDYYGGCIVRELATPEKPHGNALNIACSGNADKEALIHAIKTLKAQSKGARQAIIYLADGGITDPTLAELIKNTQKHMPLFFVDLSNEVRGGQENSSLKIKHNVAVNSIPEAIKGIGSFLRDVVLG